MSTYSDSPRSYGQFCPIACSLDLIGDRWTLLLVRDLSFGPRRFTDLYRGLPGIGRNLLSERLKLLVSAGVIEQRRLPPPAPAQPYSLTAYGRELLPILDALFHWGRRLLDPGDLPHDHLGVVPLMKVVQETAHPERLQGLEMTTEFQTGGEVFQARIAGGGMEVLPGSPHPPDLVLTAEAKTVLLLLMGALTHGDALESGAASLERGTAAALAAFLSAYS